MKILKIVALGLGALVVLLFAVGFFLPDKVHVERSVEIDAGAEKIFPYLNDFRQFNRWQPWAQLDANTDYQYSGADSGVGARMAWSSDNPNVGHGSQEIIASSKNSRVETLLDFGSEGTARAYFQLQPEDNVTRITWGFDTDFKGDIIARYFGLMFDNWIGADYEKGLASLKQLVETGALD